MVGRDGVHRRHDHHREPSGKDEAVNPSKAEQEPYKRNPEPIRVWGLSWTELQGTARGVGTARATIAGDAAEALNNWLLCERCKQPVPLIWGDLTGTDLAHALQEATKARLRQKCREGHRPVLVGAGTPPAASTEPPAPATARAAALVSLAAENGHEVTTASELGAGTGTAVFQEPLGQRREEHPVPAPADQSGKKGRTCKHRNMRMRKGVCPDCNEWVVKP
jgi:hypothetical protein